LAAAPEGIVRLFDLATLEEIERLPALGEDIRHVVYSPDGTLLVGGDRRGKIRIWSCVERRLLKELDASEVSISRLTFRADGRWLFSIDGKGQAIWWWDTVTWQPAREFVQDRTVRRLWAAAVSPDSRLLAVGDTGIVRWFDARTGELLTTRSDVHRHPVRGIAFSGDGTRAVSVSEDGTIAIWEPASRQLIDTFKGHMMAAISAAFSPDGRRFATGGGTHDAVKLWDVQSHREVITFAGKGYGGHDIAFSLDGRWLAASSEMRHLHLWHAPSWEEIEAAENRPDDVRQVRISESPGGP
jgi:WD40 repeat protein